MIIFVKNLVYGKVKTRLAAKLGDEKAFEIYQKLLEHTYNVAKQVEADKYVFYSDTIEDNKYRHDANVFRRIQYGKDLGDKMLNAFEDVFQKHYQKAVIIGSDCIEIASNHIQQAFEKINTADAVIGPAADGGYYLLGMKKVYPALFENINWSTDKVLKQTIEICNKEKLSYTLLEELHDIDEEKDWEHFSKNNTAVNIL